MALEMHNREIKLGGEREGSTRLRRKRGNLGEGENNMFLPAEIIKKVKGGRKTLHFTCKQIFIGTRS